jgi:N-acylglucosamine 2-epimerase
MNQKRIRQLHDFYEGYLFEKCLPFWLEHSLDRQNGGYLTCLDREGRVYNTDKSVWFQGRGTWLYSRLCNTVGTREDWMEAAKLGYNFLVNHCFDTDGRMFFQVTRDGKPLRKRRYFYSEAFAIIACAEYYRASGDRAALNKSFDTYKMIIDIYRDPEKDPYHITPKLFTSTRNVKSLATPMILLNVTQNLREIDKDNPVYDEIAAGLVETILTDFFKPEGKALFETVGQNGERLDIPAGRCINPGHAIEAAWFIMHEGIYRKNRDIINKALQIIDWSLELGWDKEFGGLLSFVDIEGKPPEQLEWDMKMWWPHTEALYALLLACHLTGDQKYEDWYDKMHDWSFGHFEDKTFGDWYGYLHRDGTVANTLKGSMWKGPFHLPRALLLCMKLLEEMQEVCK